MINDKPLSTVANIRFQRLDDFSSNYDQYMKDLNINKNKIKEVGCEISQNLKVTLFIPKVKRNIAKVKRLMVQNRVY